MFYAILGILVIVALFLIFRDDHDSSYNKSEKTPQKRSFSQPSQRPMTPLRPAAPVAPKPVAPVVPAAPKPVAPVAPAAPKPVAPAYAPNLSFLDEIDYYEDLVEDADTFDIAGLPYHCTAEDIGPIMGLVIPEPMNPHDSDARAIYRQDGKLLGYIPRSQHGFYESFNETNVPCPFVGEITMDAGILSAEIKAIIPTSREYVESELSEF